MLFRSYVSNGYGTEKQYGRTIHLDEMHFISGNPWGDDFTTVDITFKNRHMPAFIPARLTNLGAGEYRIDSSEDVQGIAPGQFAVIYDPAAHLCFGSGIITGRELDD